MLPAIPAPDGYLSHHKYIDSHLQSAAVREIFWCCSRFRASLDLLQLIRKS